MTIVGRTFSQMVGDTAVISKTFHVMKLSASNFLETFK